MTEHTSYISGGMLRDLRERRGMTQRELAEQLFISEKTVSKWETCRGMPDITILPELAKALGVSVTELFSGEAVTNRNRSANMKKIQFYVCPICGNVIASVGESVVSCCGIQLMACAPEEADAAHLPAISEVEDEWYVELPHPMEKEHYISFLALCGDDRVQWVKLYPEMEAAARFKRCRFGVMYLYCNRHGMMRVRLK